MDSTPDYRHLPPPGYETIGSYYECTECGQHTGHDGSEMHHLDTCSIGQRERATDYIALFTRLIQVLAARGEATSIQNFDALLQQEGIQLTDKQIRDYGRATFVSLLLKVSLQKLSLGQNTPQKE